MDVGAARGMNVKGSDVALAINAGVAEGMSAGGSVLRAAMTWNAVKEMRMRIAETRP